MKIKSLYYGWVNVIVSFLAMSVHPFVFYSFGVFITPLTKEFGWERGTLSIAWSITMIVGGLLGVFAGKLGDKYGPRPLATVNGILAGAAFLLLSRVSALWHVYLIFGLLLSVANSCFYVPVMSTIPRWFTKNRGLAVGIVVAGVGVGGIISPIMAQWLISNYGWRQAYFVLGIITLVVITVMAQFMKYGPKQAEKTIDVEVKTSEEEKRTSVAAKGYSFSQAIRTRRFWIFGLLLFSFFFTIQVILVHITPHAIDIGISPAVAAGITSIVAGSSIASRLSVGFISDKIGIRVALSGCFLILALAMVWLIISKETWMFYLFTVLFGIAYGGVVPLQNLVPAELFGLKSLGIILAAALFFGTLGGALGPPLAGYIFDITDSYRLAFILALVLSGLALILSLILLRAEKVRGQ
jgi:MFS family permease